MLNRFFPDVAPYCNMFILRIPDGIKLVVPVDVFMDCPRRIRYLIDSHADRWGMIDHECLTFAFTFKDWATLCERFDVIEQSNTVDAEGEK